MLKPLILFLSFIALSFQSYTIQASLLTLLPESLWARIMDYLPGDDYALNSFLARYITANYQTEHTILHSFISKLPVPDNKRSSHKAFQLINSFFKTTKLINKDNNLYIYWDNIRTFYRDFNQLNIIECKNLLKDTLDFFVLLSNREHNANQEFSLLTLNFLKEYLFF